MRVIIVSKDDNCPPKFPYPVKKGAHVTGGLCYNKQQYANQGTGSVGSWCARTPENNSQTQKEIKDGQGSPCEYEYVSAVAKQKAAKEAAVQAARAAAAGHGAGGGGGGLWGD